MSPAILRLDGSPCECGRPTWQCVKGDLDRCPTEDDDDMGEEFEAQDINCGMTPGRGCLLASTEWCDWDCPHSASAPHNRRIRRRLPLFEGS